MECLTFHENCGLGYLVVSALDLQVEGLGFDLHLGQDTFLSISIPSLYPTYPGLSIEWTGKCLVTVSSIKCALVVHESSAVIGLDKSGYQVKNFLIYLQKHMLWVLIRSTSSRHF